MKKAIIALILFPVFMAGVWFVALPDSLIINTLEDSLSSRDIYFRVDGFKKKPIFNFTADKVIIERSVIIKSDALQDLKAGDNVLLAECNNVKAKVDIKSLLMFSPKIDFECEMNKGRVEGSFPLLQAAALRVVGSGIIIDGMPVFELFGIRGNGYLSWNLQMKDMKGEARVSISNANLSNDSSMWHMPLNIFKDLKGVLSIDRGAVEINSFVLEGDGVYTRLNGNIAKGAVNLTAQLTVDESFESRYSLQLMLGQYKVSPGYYVIPLNVNPFSDRVYNP
ncbi:MAG: type II secretion system protein GspN [Thermodesulfovibrionales bacterium]|nr:type II secretion system protein GspN [Thermodesulfovibrionales bacterium]